MKLQSVLASGPVFSPIADPRGEPRLCTLFRTGKLSLASGVTTICRVRNISSNGFMADACPAPERGDAVALELSEGNSLAAEVIWADAGRFGAEFVTARPVPDLLHDTARTARQRPRALRIALGEAFATLSHCNRTARVAILNISQTGAAIFAYDLTLSAGTDRAIRMEIDGMDPLRGTLCWAANGAAGIQFEQPLSFETLSHWLWATSLASSGIQPMH